MLVSYEKPLMLCALQERREKIQRVVVTCPGIERRVVEQTYELTDQREYTIEEIGKILGRAREKFDPYWDGESIGSAISIDENDCSAVPGEPFDIVELKSSSNRGIWILMCPKDRGVLALLYQRIH
jgi:hypothetical protein